MPEVLQLNQAQVKLQKNVKSPFLFWIYLFMQLPMGWIAGLRVRELTPEKCVTSVPFKRLNKNPFRSTYFAVQSMAAELSTASNCLMAITGQKPSIAFIIVDMKAEFLKKATGRTFFTCLDAVKAYEAVEKCKESSEPITATFSTEGKMADGTVVSRFEFTWSFRQRKS